MLVPKSLDIIHERLLQDDTLHTRTSLPANCVRDFLATYLTTTYFQIQGVIHTQVEGAYMGSPVSHSVANRFMELFEQSALHTFLREITIWRRYADDTFVALSTDLIEPLTSHINSIHTAIKITCEDERDMAIPMLETKTIERRCRKNNFLCI